MVEKVPEFLAKPLSLHQGMVTSGRWCHITLLDHVTPVGGCSYHPLTKAERFCRKFGKFFHHNFDSVYRMSHPKLCFQSRKTFTPKCYKCKM